MYLRASFLVVFAWAGCVTGCNQREQADTGDANSGTRPRIDFLRSGSVDLPDGGASERVEAAGEEDLPQWLRELLNDDPAEAFARALAAGDELPPGVLDYLESQAIARLMRRQDFADCAEIISLRFGDNSTVLKAAAMRIGEHWAEADYEAALSWLEGIEEPELATVVFWGMFPVIANKYPDYAYELVEDKTLDMKWRERAAVQIASDYVRIEAADGVRELLDTIPPEFRDTVASVAINRLANSVNGLDGAVEILTLLPEEDLNATLVGQVATSLLQNNEPLRAMELVAELPMREDWRLGAYRAAHTAWMHSDPGSAKDWLATSGINDDVRTSLARSALRQELISGGSTADVWLGVLDESEIESVIRSAESELRLRQRIPGAE